MYCKLELSKVIIVTFEYISVHDTDIKTINIVAIKYID